VQQLGGQEESLQVKRFGEVDVRVVFWLRRFNGQVGMRPRHLGLCCAVEFLRIHALGNGRVEGGEGLE
jgi:hypothetical protein